MKDLRVFFAQQKRGEGFKGLLSGDQTSTLNRLEHATALFQAEPA